MEIQNIPECSWPIKYFMVSTDEKHTNLIKSWHPFHVQKLSRMRTDIIISVPTKIPTEQLYSTSGALPVRTTFSVMIWYLCDIYRCIKSTLYGLGRTRLGPLSVMSCSPTRWCSLSAQDFLVFRRCLIRIICWDASCSDWDSSWFSQSHQANAGMVSL
jgi:hypothetical protein